MIAPLPLAISSLLFLAALMTQIPTVVADDMTEYLDGHNSFRANFPIEPLEWSSRLASTAQEWADKCKFEHSGDTYGVIGENLYAGAGPENVNIPAAIKSWTDEESEYDPTNPQSSYFTQVVWKGTTHVGCGKALCDGIFDPEYGKALFVVCHYNPAGNVIGEFEDNVPFRK